MAKKMTIDGNGAVSHIAYAFSDVAARTYLASACWSAKCSPKPVPRALCTGRWRQAP
jgi:hypothetical protein